MSQELIYIADANRSQSEEACRHLESSQFRTICFESAERLLAQCSTALPDLIFLEADLPDQDGFAVIRGLKDSPGCADIPVVFLTGRNGEDDRVRGLDCGADDYIVKPCGGRELVARVKGIFRRVYFSAERRPYMMRFEEITLFSDSREVYRNGCLLDLSLKEYDLFKFLVRNRGKAVSRKEILENVWGSCFEGGARTVDVHIRHLRQKIEPVDIPYPYIDTVRGIGYRLRDREHSGKE